MKFLKRVFQAVVTFTYRPVLVARIILILIMTWLGVLLAQSYDPPKDPRVFSGIAFGIGLVIVVFEYAMSAIASRKIFISAVGLLMGLILAQLFYVCIPERFVDLSTSRTICSMLFGYFGIVLALRNSDWFRAGNLKFFLVNPADKAKVLDSSVIIDGRITEILAFNIISGPILVPTFVLREIQGIADSSDAYRRARGRRGLEVLDRLRKNCKTLDIIDTDFPDQPEVDQKLISVCREANAELVTNDYNLQKIAEVHQIHVFNMNELADALRPAVYVGETRELAIVRPGKEHGQGIGYLEDGTMIVVEGADNLVGQTVDIVVSNILQNPSGRLIFARLRDDEHRQMRA